MVNGSGMSSMRLFYALWPDDVTRERLASLQTHLHGKLTAYGNLHITLAFLGEQPVDKLPTLRTILDRLPRDEIVLAIDRLGYFARKRIAWAGPHTLPDALNDLVRSLSQELIEHGIAFDQRTNFKPHATLARDADAPPDFAFEPILWHANRVVLVQSTMQSNGVRYQVLAERQPHSAAATGPFPAPAA